MDIIFNIENTIRGGVYMITNIVLTQKEKTLLEDQKSHEEICIQKYTNYANLAKDPELKQLFMSHAQIEREHLNTINQLLNGQVPQMSGQQKQGQQSDQSNSGMKMGGLQGNSSMQMGGSQQMSGNQQMGSSQQSSQGQQSGSSIFNATDKDLCTDLLMTEKYVSGAYDTAIFEFKDPQVRDVLNHIQKEEQKHGEAIFKYMENKGLYQTQ